MILYHYTCDHGAELIRRDRALIPQPQPLLGGVHLVWLTDLDTPIRDALGLTSRILPCDRTEFRFAVDSSDPIWWPRYARGLRPVELRRELESAPGAMPAHWWVATTRLPLLTDARLEESA